MQCLLKEGWRECLLIKENKKTCKVMLTDGSIIDRDWNQIKES